MPSRRMQPREQPPRRSERIRQQREAASQPTTRATRATATTARTNLSTVATASRAINAHAGRRRGRGQQGGRGRISIRPSSAASDPIQANRLVRVMVRDITTGLGSRSPPPSSPPLSSSTSEEDSDSNDADTIQTSTPNPESMRSLMPLPVVPRGAPALAQRAAIGRLKREMKEFQDDQPDGCTFEILNDNLFHWKAMITGPPDTPYEGGQFYLDLMFPPDYPFSPPKVYFLTKIYHCNIASTGCICLDILSREWSPALTVPKVLLSIISLLADPNAEDPLEPSIAGMYKRHRNQHDITARSWTALYAKPEQDTPLAVVN